MSTILDKATLDSLQTRISHLSEDSIAQWGKMTVNEMVCHCTDQLRMALGELKTQDVSTFISRSILKPLVVANILKAPKGKVQTLAELNQEKAGTKPTQFEADKQLLFEYLAKFIDSEGPFAAHGGFGKLNKDQWAKMIASHLDHHLSQFGK